jgi:hypothetical protein
MYSAAHVNTSKAASAWRRWGTAGGACALVVMLGCGDAGGGSSAHADAGTSTAPPSSSDSSADAESQTDGPVTNDDGASSSGDGGFVATEAGSEGGIDAAVGPPPPSRGAAVPWDELEAEDAVVMGQVRGPGRSFGTLESEASGRRYVSLQNVGDSVRFTARYPGNSVVVRYSIPDAPGGGGADATLTLVIGSERHTLSLTSRYAWIYGGESGSSNNDPSVGGAHHFWDETHLMVSPFAAGQTLELRKEAGDTAASYAIDFIDLELVAPPVGKPAGAVSITDFGATAGDGVDDGPAFARAITAARGAGGVVYVPQGTFESTSSAIDVHDVTIAGAGMWYSEIRGPFARFSCSGNGCVYRDFAVTGETTFRDDSSPESGFLGGAGTGSSLTNIWVEHEKTGYWVGDQPTDGLHIRGCRFRDLFADGVNLCNGASHSVIEQSHARNTGDDAFAMWSPTSDGGPDVGNVVQFCSVQLPWRANCFAIYGGQDNRIADSTCTDVVEYPGLLLAQQFGSHPFAGTTTVERVTLTRAGGPMYGQQHGALKLQAFDASMSGFVVRDVDIVDATFSGVHLQGGHAIDGLLLDGITVDGAGTFGVFVDADVSGTGTANGVVVTGAASGGFSDASHGAFTFMRGAGDVGW